MGSVLWAGTLSLAESMVWDVGGDAAHANSHSRGSASLRHNQGKGRRHWVSLSSPGKSLSILMRH